MSTEPDQPPEADVIVRPPRLATAPTTRTATALRVLVGASPDIAAALSTHGLAVVAEVTDADTAVTAAVAHHPDVVLLDVTIAGGAIQAATEISVAVPDTVVVMLAPSVERDVLLAALRAGANGFLASTIDPQQLVVALRSATHGEPAFSRTTVRLLVEELRDRDRPRGLHAADGHLVMLTNREWDVAELLREGLSTERIARDLFVAPVTVRTHVSAIAHKLGVTEREQVVRLLRGEPTHEEP